MTQLGLSCIFCGNRNVSDTSGKFVIKLLYKSQKYLTGLRGWVGSHVIKVYNDVPNLTNELVA